MKAALVFLVGLNIMLAYMVWQRGQLLDDFKAHAVELSTTLEQQRQLIDTINVRQKRLAEALRNATLVRGVKE